jgi:hypothetical protein
MRLARQVSAIRESAAVHQLPEEIGWVRVGMPSFSGLETRVQTDHQKHEAWSDTVDEVVDWGVGVGGAEGFAGDAAFG